MPTLAPPPSRTFGPIGAGVTYPAASASVRGIIEAALETVPKAVGRPDYQVTAVLLPVGPLAEVATAAAPGWKLLDWGAVDRVILLIPAGVRQRPHVAIPDFDTWAGPWGEVTIDRAAAKSLAARYEFVREDRDLFSDAKLAEAQLPLMLAVAPTIRLLPLILGDETVGLARRLGIALLESMSVGSSTLVVALGAPPRSAAEFLPSLQLGRLRAAVKEAKVRMARLAPLTTAVEIAKGLGGGPLRPLTSDGEAVAMASLARIARTKDQLFEAPPASADGAWTGRLRRDALEIANKSVLGHVLMGYKATFKVGKGGLGVPSGAVVDLRIGGVLRGRAGGVVPSAPLASAIADAAYEAAKSAFPPIGRDELARLEIELTVPGPIREVTDPNELRPKRFGLVAERGSHLGFVLPQDAAALQWSKAHAMRRACVSARLPPKCHLDSEVRWKTFEARVLHLKPSPPSGTPALGPGLANQDRDR